MNDPSGRVESENGVWLETCRRLTARVNDVMTRLPSTADRATATGWGEGGDMALAVDREAESAIFTELGELHERGQDFTVLSEERGAVRFGGDSPLVVIDPIDGSLNAKRTIPFFTVSVAVASGATMESVEFGYVFDFGAQEEFWAARGAGAFLDRCRLEPTGLAPRLEAVAFEAADPARTGAVACALAGKVYRLRVFGSIALVLSYIAAGRLDGLITLKGGRSVDVAAAQLIAREAGAIVRYPQCDAGGGPPLDLKPWSPCIAARSEEHIEVLIEALAAADRESD